MPIRVVPRRDRKLNRQIKTAPLQHLRRGEKLFQAGDEATTMVLVRDGHLCLRATEGKRAGRTAAIAGPWEMVGEEALIPQATRRYVGTAGESSVVQLLEGSGVTRVLTSSRVTREAFLAGLEEDLSLARHLAVGSGSPSVEARLASVLVNLTERFGTEVRGGVLLPVRITHRSLADLAGAHRSTVTTLINEWLYTRLVKEVERSLVLPTRSKLRRLTGVWPGRGGR